jgi:hypothetical protein
MASDKQNSFDPDAAFMNISTGPAGVYFFVASFAIRNRL